jgi:tetratricopeptide (TPR) repeat protein
MVYVTRQGIVRFDRAIRRYASEDAMEITMSNGSGAGLEESIRLTREGTDYLEREAFDEAVAAFRQALALNPESDMAEFNLGAALAGLGDLDQSMAVFRNIIDRKPDVVETHTALAAALDAHRIPRFEPGMRLPATDALDAVLATYRQAVDSVPVLYGCYSTLEEILNAVGRSAEARAMAAQSEIFNTELPYALQNVGATMQHPGDFSSALALHRNVMAMAPDHEYMTEQDYLKTDLTFSDSEITLPDGFEVMMEWERPIMERSAEIICHNQGDVLNVGFGMAIIDTAIQQQGVTTHTIIEAHEQVVEKARQWAEDKKGVNLVHSTWQDALDGLPLFDGVYLDTLMPPIVPFLERVPAMLKKDGVFLYFQSMIQLENLEAMSGQGLGLGIELHPFDDIPENSYYRLTEKTPDGQYLAPLFVYQKLG